MDIPRGAPGEAPFTAKLQPTDPIEVWPEGGVSFMPGYRVDHPRFDATELHGTMSVVTEGAEVAPLQDHLKVHRGLGALVGLAYGKAAGFTGHSVAKNTDVIRMLDGTEREQGWLELVTHRTEIRDAEPIRDYKDNLLFDYPLIGGEGVREWLRLWEAWPRAIYPLAGMVRMRSTFLEAQFSQLGIGLEALGYYLAMERGAGQQAADNLDLVSKY